MGREFNLRGQYLLKKNIKVRLGELSFPPPRDFARDCQYEGPSRFGVAGEAARYPSHCAWTHLGWGESMGKDEVTRISSDAVFDEICRRFAHPICMVEPLVGQKCLCDLVSLGAQLRYRCRFPKRTLQQRTHSK